MEPLSSAPSAPPEYSTLDNSANNNHSQPVKNRHVVELIIGIAVTIFAWVQAAEIERFDPVGAMILRAFPFVCLGVWMLVKNADKISSTFQTIVIATHHSDEVSYPFGVTSTYKPQPPVVSNRQRPANTSTSDQRFGNSPSNFKPTGSDLGQSSYGYSPQQPPVVPNQQRSQHTSSQGFGSPPLNFNSTGSNLGQSIYNYSQPPVVPNQQKPANISTSVQGFGSPPLSFMPTGSEVKQTSGKTFSPGSTNIIQRKS